MINTSKILITDDGAALETSEGLYSLDTSSVKISKSSSTASLTGYLVQIAHFKEHTIAVIAESIVLVSQHPVIYRFENFKIVSLSGNFVDEDSQHTFDIYSEEIEYFLKEFPLYAFEDSDYILEQNYPKVGDFFKLNYASQRTFADTPLDTHLVDCFTGFVDTQRVGDGYLTIIARRSPHNIGTRYMRRGLDKDADAANEVLSSFIYTKGNTSTVFNILRGSVPLEWHQELDFSYKPNIVIDNTSLYSVHMNRTVHQYGSTHMVNLMKDSGKEGVLTNAILQVYKAEALPDVMYTYFNFAVVCDKMRYNNANILIDTLEDEIAHQGVAVFQDGKMVQQQHGIFRINCLDCLDRTNVVQSLITRRAFDMVPSNGFVNEFNYETVFRNLWTDHGNAISVQYSGTNAMKGDFVRTGRRTVVGSITDGVNSLRRYYKNHFDDGFKQSVIDSFCTSVYEVSPEKSGKKFFRLAACATGTILLLNFLGAGKGTIVGAVSCELGLAYYNKDKFICRDKESIDRLKSLE